MHTRAFDNPALGKLVIVRPLADGDTAAVAALFDRLGPASRELRYHGAKPELMPGELVALARVDADNHVLVTYVDGDPLPVAMARIVRNADDRSAGEIAFEVADAYQGFGIGRQLLELLLADARAAGIERLDAVVETCNRAALRMLRRALGTAAVRVAGSETVVTATV